jgi:hypothetical protein
MSSLDITRAIVPIVRRDADGHIIELLGTGFYVGQRPAVVTARHVFADNPLLEGQKYSMVFISPDGTIKLGDINDFLPSQEFDIAVFAAGSVPGAIRLPLTRTEVATNQDVLTYEFSSTRIERQGQQRVVEFLPFTHKGNVMRHYISSFPESRPTPVFDTSFPALQGASGAPVIRAHDFVVIGMLVANHERHLMPAQIVRIVSDEKEMEETKYFLPTGRALEGAVIVDYLCSIQANPEIVD